MRGRVEVAGEERRNAARRLPREGSEVRTDLAEPRGTLVRQHLGLRLAVAHQLRAVRARRQVHVADRHHAARANGHVAEADPAALHRVDGIARGDVKGLVGVGHAGRFRDATEVPLRLLHANHVRARRADGLSHPVEFHLSAAVPDVECHHGERVRRGRAREQQKRKRGAERREPFHRSTSACSGCQPSLTRSPISQRSSERCSRGVLLQRDEPHAGGELDDHLGGRAHVDALDDRPLDRDHAVLELVEPDLLRPHRELDRRPFRRTPRAPVPRTGRRTRAARRRSRPSRAAGWRCR